MNVLLGHDHDLMLVILSYIVAFLASYTALDMGERVGNATSRARKFWLAGSAVVLGGGIWSMHFIAMLALQVALPVTYELHLTVASLFIAIGLTWLGFLIVSRGRVTLPRLFAAGFVVGIGVAAMHYTGMAAMRIDAAVYYDPFLFTLSIVIAVVAATVALWLAFGVRNWWQNLAAATVMAAAICGMHYTGMAAMIIELTDEPTAKTGLLNTPLLAVAVAIATLALMCLALVSVFIDRRFEALAEREAARLREANALLQVQVNEREAAEARLRDAHQALEERVRARTQELATANEELQAARLRAEQEKERAEKASNAKSDFLSNMSHELRTPLNSILGFAQLLEFNAKDPLSARQAKQVGQIRKSGDHLLTLIDDVLDLSKIEAGRVKLSVEPVEIKSVFEQIRTTLSPMADAAQVTVKIDQDDTSLMARADRTRLVQVLMNLAGNALKYNRIGGALTLSAQAVSESIVRVMVVDTGHGIPQDRQSELFQPFNRLGAEQGAIEGTGIGLTITQRLVHLMGGEISFTSVTGIGTTFVVDLPRARPSVIDTTGPALAGAKSLSGRRNAVSLLYIEDNPSNIELMQGLIEALDGIELLTAATPTHGLSLAGTRRPDVIVLDIDLPEMNGYEVLKRLKANPETAHIPVIALSAAAMPRDVERGRAAGFKHYLTKPIKVREFIAALDGAVDAPLAAVN
jgi:NO-binding membrane sensor protein with MHYT domain/CheY-like chemotaxis protein